jgi:GcrA cell cycle regulator
MTVWTDNNNDRLKTLYAAGMSCSQIASELGNGFSRNAVIGRIHRMKLERRGANGNYNGSGRGPALRTAEAVKPRARITLVNSNSNARRVTVAPEPVELKPLRCAEVVPLGVSLIDLEPSHCRWPYGDREITNCGHPKLEDRSYCGAHKALASGKGTVSERAAGYAPKLVLA